MSTRRGRKNQKKVRLNLGESDVTRRIYPFAAILGQRDMKLALLLNIVDPLIGGVLIMGHRGTGKSTAVRALSELVPQIQVVSGCFYRCDPANYENICNDCSTKLRAGRRLPTSRQPVKVVELPLGATEDRVCGTINIERALKEGATTFEPGLLAQANRGFLYIDEVNLLEDHLVDVLLDVAGSGWNRVEREGVSIEHPSRFVLIGSGNPEEGELRPQLIDRFGLHVEVKTEEDLDSRIAVVERREAFDREPDAFAERFDSEQKDLVRAVTNARRNLAKIEITPAVKTIARACAVLKVEGHRGELTLMRAARALAALEGRKRVGDDDVKRIAPMALRHRLRHNVFEDTAAQERILDAFEQTAKEGTEVSKEGKNKVQLQSEDSKGFDRSRRKERAGNEDRNEISSEPPAKHVTQIPLKWKPNSREANSHERTSGGIRRKASSEQRGRHSRSVSYKTGARRIALLATVRALVAAGASSFLDRDATDTIRYKLFSRKRGTLFIFLIDTSGSMGRHRIALAKRAVLDLLRQSYLNRDSVAIITFRDVSASIALPPSRSILRARQAIESLTTGGRTPLSAGMTCALDLVRRIRDQHSDKCVLLFTDGRANVPLREEAKSSTSRERLIEEEVKQLAAAITRTRTKLVVVDTQRHFERSEEPSRLARGMDAQLIRLEY